MFTTTLKFQGCYTTCSKCPPSHCMLPVSHCVILCCYCFFLIPMVASFMDFTEAFFVVYYYETVIAFMQPHRKTNWIQVARPSGPSHWPISSNPFTFIIFIQIFFYLCEYVEVPCNIVATFELVLQEAHPQKLESFWNMELLNVCHCQWSSQVIA